MERISNRITSRAGESIAETLVAVLIMALAFLVLTGAVLTAARINARIQNKDVAFNTQENAPETTEVPVYITLDGDSEQSEQYKVLYHRVTNGTTEYEWYEYNEPTE